MRETLLSEQEGIAKALIGLSDDAIIAARKANVLGAMQKKYNDMEDGKDKSALAKSIISARKSLQDLYKKIAFKKKKIKEMKGK